MVKKLLFFSGILLLAAGCNSAQPAAPAPASAGNQQQGAVDQAGVKIFTVKGTNFSFSPSTITVKKGDKVKIVFQDDDGFHDLVVSGYNAQTKRVNSGQSSEVTFTADKTGTFEYYCSVGNHREKGMKGSLIVE